MYADYEKSYKVIMAGSSGVGKSSLLLRFVDNHYQTNLLATIGVDFKFKTVQVQDKKVRLQIWDTAGSQAFRSIASAYYHGAHAVILVFNLTSQQSWKQLTQFWIEEVLKYKDEQAQLVLIGNMADLQHKDILKQQQIKAFMKKSNITLYFQTSAKTGDQVANAFQKLAQKLFNSPFKGVSVSKMSLLDVQQPQNGNQKNKKRCCK